MKRMKRMKRMRKTWMREMAKTRLKMTRHPSDAIEPLIHVRRCELESLTSALATWRVDEENVDE